MQSGVGRTTDCGRGTKAGTIGITATETSVIDITTHIGTLVDIDVGITRESQTVRFGQGIIQCPVIVAITNLRK